MAKLTLDTITSGYGTVDRLNSNFDRIEVALENTLSLDGTLPNAPTANLDMNSKRIMNLPAPAGSNDPARLIDLQDAGMLLATLPSQSGAAGKFLKSDGLVASWNSLSGSIAIAGTDVSNTPAGGISSTNVQAALNELDTEKANLASPTFTGTPNLPTGTTGVTQSAGDSSTKLATTAFVAATLPSGMVMDFAGSSVPTGWLECDGSAVSRATYASLFTAISTVWGAGDGSTTFNLPDARGKGRIGKGTGTVTASGVNADVDTTADTLTVAANNTKWITGMSVVFTLSSGTITGLTSGNTYYVIRASSTTVKLASTLALAQAGTPVDMTAKSTPVWTITSTFSSRSLGETGGEEAHAESSTEQLAHSHTGGLASNSASGPYIHIDPGTVRNNSYTTDSVGGNSAMNIMHPFGVYMTIIKI